ncbi:unnamed protein product [Prunus armeniaca]
MKNHTSLVGIGGWSRRKMEEENQRNFSSFNHQSSGLQRGEMGGLERGRRAETFGTNFVARDGRTTTNY